MFLYLHFWLDELDMLLTNMDMIWFIWKKFDDHALGIMLTREQHKKWMNRISNVANVSI